MKTTAEIQRSLSQNVRLLIRVITGVAIVFFTAFLWIVPVVAAEPPQRALAEAQRLRDAGDFAGAAELLRVQIVRSPDDGEAARLLAQTLYWLKDIRGARAVYEASLVRHPEDATLQLQYARMLAETGEARRARELLNRLLDIPVTRAETATLLGMLAYWEGDLTTARGLFLEAIEANPDQEEAQRQLQEILISTAPWFRVSSNAWHDDQPLNRLALGLEAGWFATPLTEFTARFQPMPYRFDGSSRTVGIAEAAVTRRMPAVRLDTELAAGGIRRPQGGGSWNWTGRAAMGLHLPAHVTLRARVERTPYLSTGASLNTPVMVRTVTGTLHWDGARGWLGEASYQRQRYPDDNASRTAYGWLLAPLIFREHLEIQGGYAAAASNAKSSRFVLVRPNQPYAPSDPRFDTTGHYAPYYTPSHLVTHSAIAALTLRNGRTTFRMGGAYAVRATDDAPFFDVSGGGALRSTYSRQFSPWNIHASLKIDVRDHFTIEPSGEIGHSAFYSWATAGFQITYHFTTGAVRRASAP